MIGKPKYKEKDFVDFVFNGLEKTGVIAIIDRFGTIEQSEEVSYDIVVLEDNTMYKHIVETDVLRKNESSLELDKYNDLASSIKEWLRT